MPKRRNRMAGRAGPPVPMYVRAGKRFSSVRRGKKALESLGLKAETRRQISGFVQIALAVVLFLVLKGEAGIAGEGIERFVTFFFGSAGIALPVALGLSGVLFLFGRGDRPFDGLGVSMELRSAVGLVLCLIAVLGLVHIRAPFEEIGVRRTELGGAIGFMVAFPLLAFTSPPVAYVVLGAVFLVGLLVTFEVNVVKVLAVIAKGMKGGKKVAGEHVAEGKERKDEIEEGMERGEAEGRRELRGRRGVQIVRPVFAREELSRRRRGGERAEERSGAAPMAPVRSREEAGEDGIELSDIRFDDWEFPSPDCLDFARSEVLMDDKTLQAQAKLIEEKLKEFDIDVAVKEAHPGPTVTQFALEPAEGVKLSRIAALKDDLALALAAPSLRIEAPIPGRSLVGIEMPNAKRTIVHLREMIESPEFRESASPLSLPFGRDVSGKAIIEDLADMPHLLIAGATGSGKSVCMNTFLLSFLYQNAPHELKLILIDPKRVELTLYEGIPHLLAPVITESEKALKALRWAVAEMGRRLARFSEAGVRNIQEFNEKQPEERHVPRVVIVIDELADLMMRQYRRDTELMVTRIAQIARATGIHLIIATQRPSVDVITGIIKANIPTRIAFRTVSSVDSRTILDSVGAEDLLGKGDMLHITALTPLPKRVQGVFVSSREIERVIRQVKIAGGGRITAEIPLGTGTAGTVPGGTVPGWQAGWTGTGMGTGTVPGGTVPGGQAGMGDDDASTPISTGFDDTTVAVVAPAAPIDLDADDDGGDDLTFEAMDLVRRTGRASASLLQRHLKVGYARAARILDILEEKGVIGPGEGAKARKVYVE